MNFDLRKTMNLERINRARHILDWALKIELINVNDIFSLLKKDKNYSLEKANNYKELLLKQIVSCPFILCDQERLDVSAKHILPLMLQVRYQEEIEELEMMQELGYMDEQELQNEKDMLEFIYYLSSEEGREIIDSKENNNVLQKIKR